MFISEIYISQVGIKNLFLAIHEERRPAEDRSDARRQGRPGRHWPGNPLQRSRGCAWRMSHSGSGALWCHETLPKWADWLVDQVCGRCMSLMRCFREPESSLPTVHRNSVVTKDVSDADTILSLGMASLGGDKRNRFGTGRRGRRGFSAGFRRAGAGCRCAGVRCGRRRWGRPRSELRSTRGSVLRSR